MEIVILLAIVLAGFGAAVLQLWNWLMPSIFGLRPITYWQALGLLGLSWILLGQGFLRRPGYQPHWRGRMIERWEQMTPEQRQQFRQGMRGGCGRSESPAGEPKA